MATKKRNRGMRRTHRQGLSGNPARRAEQLRQERPDVDQAAMLGLAYWLARGAAAEPWWRESHERILETARAVDWPSHPVDLETQACRIVGDEFYDRLQSPSIGLHPAQWLRVLAEETGAALRTALAAGDRDWRKLWALLRGLVLTTPRMVTDAASDPERKVRGVLPEIKDPLSTARAEADKAAAMLAGRGLATETDWPIDGCRPVGQSLLARDVYGSRLLLTAPFGYAGTEPDHWYAWDIDLCWISVVVDAGVFVSADEALREWRSAVGPAASGAATSRCAAELTVALLAPCLETGFLANILQGHEPRELIREHYRLRRRARDLADSVGAGVQPASFDATHAHEEFLDWYVARHDDVPRPEIEDAGTVLTEWGPHIYPDERSFYACSPHRVEMTAHLIRDGYIPEYANAALRLLPAWTRWCIEHSGLGGDAAARSSEAARIAASTLVRTEDDEGDESVDKNDELPFRRRE